MKLAFGMMVFFHIVAGLTKRLAIMITCNYNDYEKLKTDRS